VWAFGGVAAGGDRGEGTSSFTMEWVAWLFMIEVSGDVTGKGRRASLLGGHEGEGNVFLQWGVGCLAFHNRGERA
jgi:hypothetical protein